ncbi:MAG: DNA adenine methylase [Methylocystis sp.]|nr:DNA adenine methylase [Methylocystis sp.]
MSDLVAPFPYFGGKRHIAPLVWSRLGRPKQYIEPFCGSAAMLLAAPKPASLEVVCDMNGFIANFWRAVKHQPAQVAEWGDYPVSHIDLGARHKWLMDRRANIADGLQDPDWPGDAKVAGWWLWGQCAWIGSGWCDWERETPPGGQIPHVTDAGRGVQALGKIPHVTDAGRGVQALTARGDADGKEMLTSSGRVAMAWLRRLSDRLDRVRVIHGDWKRSLNTHHGTHQDGVCAVFLDPPYVGFEGLYGAGERSISAAVAEWADANAHIRIALCGHDGDYDLPGWEVVAWKRVSHTMGSSKTRDSERIWFSPACLRPEKSRTLFDAEAAE